MSVDPHEVTVVRSRFLQAPFEVWLAVAATYAGLSHFLPLPPTGGARAVEMTFPALTAVWSVLYAAGGLVILAGMARRSTWTEVAGLHLLGSGATVACMAAIGADAAILPTVTIQGGVVVACVVRLWVLRRLAR